MPTKNYTYAARRPIEGEEIIGQQISLAHKYYNRLIELHREMRDAVERAKLARFPALADIDARIAEAEAELQRQRDAIRRQNAQARRKRATPEERQSAKAAATRLKELRAERKAMREAIKTDPALVTEIAAIRAASQEAQRTARKSSGIYWGTYLQTEAAVEAAIEKTKFGPPRFRRWSGDGSVGCQIQGGLTATEITACADTRLRVESWTSRGKSAPVVVFAVRISSNDSGKPIFARLPVYYHRPLPDDARVKWAKIIRRAGPVRRQSDGSWRPYYDWSVQLALTTGEEHPRAEAGACGVDLGWRKLPDDSLRVAYLVGDDGHVEEFCLPAKVVSRWDKAESIQETRDKLFDTAKARLAEWLEANGCPEKLRESCASLRQWRSHGRLARIIDTWERFAGDEEIHAALKEWRERESHLWQYEFGTRRTGQRQRKELYRQFAARLRGRYKTIVVEDCDWRTLARNPQAEDDQVSLAAMKRYMRIASVGMLRDALRQCGAIMDAAKDTTRSCHRCGKVNDWDQASEVWHTCDECGLLWDQDENAARNLLSRADVVGAESEAARGPDDDAGDGDAPAEPEKGGRWGKRKAARSQKAAQPQQV